MSLRTAATLIGAFAATALGHGVVESFKADGVEYSGYKLDNYYAKQNGQAVPDQEAWSAENLDNGFVAPSAYGTADINCHKNSAPGAISATVKAGGEVEFVWSAWPESHFGPVFTYVAKCAGDCADADVETLKWVKIDEGGIDIASQKWAATDLIENDNTWVTTVPETLAPGNYVFRHEIIAMHGAGDADGAQNYPQCFNIEITGSGSDNPEGVLGTKLYTATESGIKFNPYTNIESYDIPGPALYGSGGSGSSPTPVVPAVPANSTVASPETPVATVPTSLDTPVVLPVEPTATAGNDDAAATTAPSAPAVTQPSYEDEETGSGSGSGSGNSSALPKTFTLDTFIDWLRKNAGSPKTRRHARALKF